MQTQAKAFASEVEVADYYDQRFESNYMCGWDSHIEAKIRTFFSQINLPDGTYLDFGCGQGSLTGILKSIHPQGQVEGCDVSSVAIQKALEQNPGIGFALWQSHQMKKNYSLIFSHHVLEHVLDLEETLNQLDKLTSPGGLHCHILPCGNPGSLEWKVAKATTNGFEANGRFFFEEDGHLRRLTSDQLAALYAERGYQLVRSQFTNQYQGAFKWIIDLGPKFIHSFANPNRGKSLADSLWLYTLKIKLLLLWQMRSLAHYRPTAKIKRLIYSLMLPLAKSYVSHFSQQLGKEATNCLSHSQGSEMLMCFYKL